MRPLDPALLTRLPASAQDTLRASLEAEPGLGPRHTITPEGAKPAGALEQALAVLGSLDAGQALTRRGTLGEGGMGVVHLAEQRALGREVAVKSVKPDARSPESTLKLLREAWITGAIEHPNVIPVHDVRLDRDGQPQIVLKKVEGQPWSALLAAPEAIRERFGARDPVEWHLRVLAQVARAVAHAHARGFLHRDLKPENVMIGAFGEVYVVDWGLAVALEDDGTGRFPLARDARQMAGTPCYMAPEMLGGAQVTLDARTDVYLLGAMLFELVTGRPPRDGEVLLEVISKILEPVEVPAEVPEELADIVRRAMAFEPAARFPTAEAFHGALLDYLAHRGSIQLAREALARLDALREADDDRADALFAECRFGLQQALRAWPENPLARRGLSAALERRIGHELARGNAKVAGHLLRELPEPAPALAQAVEEALRAERASDARRAALERDQDPSIGRRTRAFLGVVLTSIWVVGPLVMWWLGPEHPVVNGYPGGIAGTLALMGVGLLLTTWAHDSLSKTRINRQLMMTVRLTLLAQLALLVGGYLAGIPFVHAHAFLTLTWASGAALVASAVDPRLYASALGYLLAFFAVIRWPEHRHLVTSLANLVVFVSVLVLWASPHDDLVEPIERRLKERIDRRSSRP